ncbi:MAG TPA: hypothetical protein VHS34_11910 [Terriglobales bacterium]|jgi:hypothetical protein|nr:hypothetical protein [Terriglobales bacterium]
MTIGLKADVPEAVHFFERSPFRWWPFIIDTILLFMSTLIDGFIVIKYWGRLPLVTVTFLLAVALGMWLLWRAALTAHRRVHEIQITGMFGEVVPGSPVESVIRVAASMTHLGLFFNFLLVAFLLMQIDRLLSH